MTIATNKDLYQPKSRPEFPRRFVPRRFDAGDWDQIERLLEDLETREIRTKKDLEQWIADLGELVDVISEDGSRRNIALSRFTEDKEIEARYNHFIQNIVPRLKVHFKKLEDKFLEAPSRRQLAKRYEVYDRNTAASAELFRPENVKLQTKVSELVVEYGKLTGAMTVKYKGKTRTLQQMGVFFEDPDRAVREEAWRLVADRRLQDRNAINRVYDKMLKLRHQMARNAGKKNYEDYAFRSMLRFDYTPTDCRQFARAVSKHIVPLMRKLDRERQKAMGLSKLRPWDLAVDVEGRPPLKPFESAEELTGMAKKLFRKVDPDFAKYIADMEKKGLFDLESRKGKRPGGFMSDLSEIRLPFIFMNAAGLHRDLETILHEAGHAFHVYLSREIDISSYRNEVPLEFAEVASMSMELVAGEYLEDVYAGEDAARARRKTLEGIVNVLPWIATIDEFQRWIYRNPDHSRQDRRDKWLALNKRFGHKVDWTGLNQYLESGWHRQLHLFHHPFYYIEYGIAQLGALQVWANYKKNPDRAMDRYKSALALGGSKPLPELFRKAGLNFDFGEDTVAPLAELLQEELEALDRV